MIRGTATVLAIVTSLLIATATSSVAAHRFDDVGDDHPFHDEIGWLADEGITGGFDDGTFRPADPVTRQAMVRFLYVLAGEPGGDYPDPGFSDVAYDHPFADEIAWASHKDIVQGYDDGTFGPDREVARQAAVAFLHRLAGQPDTDASQAGFSDVDEDHPFHDEIAWAADIDVTSGYDDGTFRPSAAVARQAAASYLHGFPEELVPALEGEVGETMWLTALEGEDLEVTVEEIIDQVDHSAGLEPDGRYVTVELTYRLLSGSEYEDAPGNQVEAVDTDDRGHTSTSADTDDCAEFGGSVRMREGDRRSGCVVFDLPEDTDVAHVDVTPDSGFGPGTGRWLPAGADS